MRYDARDSTITPNLNKLAKNGADFIHAYSSTPTCTPARAAILTGRSPYFHGMLGYGKIALHYPQGEFPKLLQKLGYYTEAIGKDHFGWNFTSNSGNKHGYDERTLYDGVGDGFKNSTEFDDYDQWFQHMKPGIDPNFGFMNHNEWISKIYPYDDMYHPTAWVGKHAIEFINSYRRSRGNNNNNNDDIKKKKTNINSTKPFFLKVSFHRPHSQYDPPLKYFNLIPNEIVSKPIVGGNWDERFKTDVINCGPQKNDAWCGNMPYHDTMTTRRSYFANILFLDEQIGLIINALKENNFINNTFIIFVSDHGDGQGDHYHWRKGYPYEFSSHVPFIIHWPETILSWKRGQIREEVVELRDLFPTFLDIANGTNLIPNDINGSSILDLLRRSSSSSSSSSKKDIIDGSDATTTSTSWRQWIDLEHDICYNITNHWNALTDGKMKYIYRAYFGDEQLFNLTNDQYEMNDLSKDNKYIDVLEMWRKRLVQQFVNEQRGVSWVNDEGKLMKRVQGMLYSRYYPKILPEENPA